MGRSVIGLCGMAGGTVGSFVPALWGGSGLGLASIVFALVGGIAGVFFGVRLSRIY